MVADRLTTATANGSQSTNREAALRRDSTQGLDGDLSPTAAEALRAVERGRWVLPCWGVDPQTPSPRGYACLCSAGAKCDNPGKHPRVAHPYKAATNRASRVAEWAKRWPDANWAWVPGRSGHADLDVDNRRGGDEALYDAETQHGRLPDTERVLTGDGVHVTFRLPQGVTLAAGEIAPGLEVKTGPTSYVMLPSSRHYSGVTYEYEVGYEPHEVEIAELPRWIIELAGKSNASGLRTVPRELRGFDPADCPPLDRSRLERLLSPGRHLGRLWNHDAAVGGDRTPSGWDFKLLLELHRLGFGLTDAFPVLAEHRRLHRHDDAHLFRVCRPNRHSLSQACAAEYVLWTWLRVLDYAQMAKPEAHPIRRVERAHALTATFECRDAIFRAGGNPTHVLALEVLSVFARDGVCFMSGSKLAPELNCKPRNASHVLQFLEKRGFIRRLSEPRRGYATVWELVHLGGSAAR